jgi:hypothetical protein
MTNRLECPECGATAEASCNCGVPYLPASKRADKAIAENPGLSNVALAAIAHVDEKTVRTRRKSTSENSEVRTGRDGKRRKMPTTGPKAGARVGITKPSRRKVKIPPSGVPLSTQLNNLMWQLSKFREDWVETAKAFNLDHIRSREHRGALARCAASNALALNELAEALQEESAKKGNGHDEETRTLHS